MVLLGKPPTNEGLSLAMFHYHASYNDLTLVWGIILKWLCFSELFEFIRVILDSMSWHRCFQSFLNGTCETPYTWQIWYNLMQLQELALGVIYGLPVLGVPQWKPRESNLSSISKGVITTYWHIFTFHTFAGWPPSCTCTTWIITLMISGIM